MAMIELLEFLPLDACYPAFAKRAKVHLAILKNLWLCVETLVFNVGTLICVFVC